MPKVGVIDLLTAVELADRLKVKPKTVRLWARQGRIPTRKLSHNILRFSLLEVVAALKAAGRKEGRDGGRRRHRRDDDPGPVQRSFVG